MWIDGSDVITLEQAIAAAARIHAGEEDKGGAPYILHPLRVMLTVKPQDDLHRIVAVLHDTVEHAGWDELLRTLGLLTNPTGGDEMLGEIIRAALDAISKREGEWWKPYIGRVSQDPIARAVKIADLRDNMNLARIPQPTDRDRSRVEGYRRALAFLMGEASFDDVSDFPPGGSESSPGEQ
jgi:(p)ppGpp synthase/HD superfamily hydrolase